MKGARYDSCYTTPMEEEEEEEEEVISKQLFSIRLCFIKGSWKIFRTEHFN